MKTHAVEAESFSRWTDGLANRQTDIETLIVAVNDYVSNKIMTADKILSFLNSK